MHFNPQTFHIKSGQSILIRVANTDDGEKLRNLKLQYLKDTDTIPLFDYEYPNTIKEEETLIQNYKDQPNSLLLVAEYQGSLVGNIDLTGSWRKKMFHTAVIGMGIHPEWQNQGIGTLLIQSILEWSKTNNLLKTLWLEVYATNNSGIALYNKVGFQESGRIKNFFFENNKYLDKIIMSKSVS